MRPPKSKRNKKMRPAMVREFFKRRLKRTPRWGKRETREPEPQGVFWPMSIAKIGFMVN
jgi:hypothetical protein